MNKLAWVLAIAGMAYLAGAAAAQTSQQNRMAGCNSAAAGKNLAGDARKSFMAECLSKGPEAMAPAGGSPQQRMADCNAAASAGAMKGDARQSFMSSCLKGQGGGTAAATSKQAACATQADSRKLAGAARTSFLTKCAG